MAQDIKPVSHKRRKFKKLVITLIVLAVIGGVGYFLARQMLVGPAIGTIITTVPVSQATPPAEELQQFEGKYMTFAIPVSYEKQPQKPTESNSLESHTFVSSGMSSKIVTITVTSLPSGKLSDDASYYMRTLRPERYKMSEMTIMGEKVAIAENKEEYQRTAFWAHAGKMLTFSISGISTDTQAVTAEYQKMLESIRWR